MVTNNGAASERPEVEQKADEQKPVDLRPAVATPKPTRVLPTNRIAFAKQLDTLRAFDAASGQMRKPVPLTEVAKLLKLAPQTMSLASPFFLDSGLIRKGEGGGFIPSDAVHEYALAHAWEPEQAAHKLAPLLAEHWAWQALLPQLQFKKNMTEREALGMLSSAANAAPDYRPQLLLLLAFLDACGLIEFADSNVRLLNAPNNGAVTPKRADAPSTDVPASSRPNSAAAVSSTFTQHPEGQLQFAVSVRVDMSEFSSWRPDRIAAFFAGVAQVLAAKADVEQVTADNGG